MIMVLCSVGQHLFRMLARIHFGIRSFDLALLIDEEADAIGIARLRIGAGAIRQAELAVGIAEQFVGKIELLGEGGVSLDTIETDAEDYDASLLEIGVVVAEPATLDGSARGISLGIEPQQNLAAAQSGQRDRIAVMREDGKIRRLIADIEHSNILLANRVRTKTNDEPRAMSMGNIGERCIFVRKVTVCPPDLTRKVR